MSRSRVSDLKLIHACRIAGQKPPDDLVVWEPETESFDALCKRIASSPSSFDGVEHRRGNWFVKFSMGKGKYRWQMPDEDTARKVERYAATGGGHAFARRKAIRSYKWDEATSRWATLHIKTSKKWQAQRAERARTKRLKRAKRRAQDAAVAQNKEWARGFEERLKAYEEEKS
jgi:hypothetical protein